jgi:hypothetical protein
MLSGIAYRLLRLSWALWLGGLIALFIFVNVLFRRERSVAVQAAPMMFHAFEKYQLILGAVALVGAAALFMVTRSVRLGLVFSLLAVASIGAVVSPVFITAKMEALRAEGMAGGSEFKKLHGRSMMVYVGDAAVLALAGVLMPSPQFRRK